MWLCRIIYRLDCFFEISTHTSRVGCDFSPSFNTQYLRHFYSHIPCGMWRNTICCFTAPASISTHTSRVGCDLCTPLHTYWYLISTHTSRVGCDQFGITFTLAPDVISTHTSRVGCDYDTDKMELVSDNFYSHIPCGMWRQLGEMSGIGRNFYSHIPCGMWPLYIVYFNHIIPIYYRMDL